MFADKIPHDMNHPLCRHEPSAPRSALYRGLISGSATWLGQSSPDATSDFLYEDQKQQHPGAVTINKKLAKGDSKQTKSADKAVGEERSMLLDPSAHRIEETEGRLSKGSGWAYME